MRGLKRWENDNFDWCQVKNQFQISKIQLQKKKKCDKKWMEISAIKGGGSDAEWQMPLKISMYFLGLLPYSQLPPVEKTNSKYWSDEKLFSIKFVKKKTISNVKVEKLYKSKQKAMFESLGSKIDVF